MEKNNAERLSVIIPAYQAEMYLAQTVDSVRRQRWPWKIEIIIVDDGSSDGTLSIAQKCGDVVLSKCHYGAASARNVGLEASSGQWIFFLDADDMLLPGALAALYAPFVAKPGLMATFGMAEDFISPELTDAQRHGLPCRRDPYGGILPGCALMRRETFDKIGLFDETLMSGETISWQMKLRDAGLPTEYVEAVTLMRRIHLTNIGRIYAKQEMLNYAVILRDRMKKK